jgi:hypothetical protein
LSEKLSIDEAHNQLHAACWSTGDVGVLEVGKLVWQVYAHKGDVKLVAKSENRTEAWQQVVRMAAKVC